MIRLVALNDVCDGPVRVTGILFNGLTAGTITLQDRTASPATIIISPTLAAGTTSYFPISAVFPLGLKWSAGASIVGTVTIFLAPLAVDRNDLERSTLA
jgi:hypothetical protein